MHAFTASLPAYHSFPGLEPRAAAVLVYCHYDAARQGFAAGVARLNGQAVQQCEQVSLAALLKWLRESGIHWPGGLPTALYRDAQAAPGEPSRLVYWREQGPEVLGLLGS